MRRERSKFDFSNLNKFDAKSNLRFGPAGKILVLTSEFN
ncbi:hypothetical protein CAMRE0001_2184 [Campylobacter rectus RM3267]|uniref:Uncharacterized protein n=1 Tax=Campylobacter rectus RM3267 TaxID=553218 RepID=B9D487_CAMRE|nr:hypothetical protein CAMRE0001_2184 [Campylobacter rectus RM3267]